MLPTASPRSRLGRASAKRSGGRPRRPSARLFVLQSGRRPPSHPSPPSGPPPIPQIPQELTAPSPFPSQLTKGRKSLFSLPSPVLGEARRMPFAPPTKNSPAAPGRHRGFTHFLPAGRPVSGTSAPRLVPRQRPGPPAGPRPTPPQRVWPRHALSPSEHTRASARPDPCPARHSHRQPR